MKKTHLLYTAAMTLFMACTNDNGNTGTDRLELMLTASQQTAVAATMTRAADGLYTATTGFDGGETVRVFFGTEQADYRVDAADNNAHSTLYGGGLCYPLTGTGTLPLYAVYPATSAASHTVAYDQTGEVAYKASDLMYATTSVDLSEDRRGRVHELSFRHQLVKMRFVITKDASIDGLSVTKVEMKNVKRQTEVTPGAIEATLGTPSTATGDDAAEGDNILVYGTIADAGSYESVVLFPAQSWNEETFLEVSLDNGETATFLLTKSDWQPGGEYTMNINVHSALLGMTSEITDWQPDGTISCRPMNMMAIGDIADQTFTGEPVTPTPEVTYNDRVLTPDEDYYFVYRDNDRVGEATITAVGLNSFAGKTVSKTFNIIAAEP